MCGTRVARATGFGGRRAAQVLGVGCPSAQKNIDRLVKAGIIWEISGRVRNRIYLAGEIIEAVEGKPLAAELRREGTK